MFCKYCGHKSNDAKMPCGNCKKNGFDFNQNGYGSAKELLDVFIFLEVEKEALKNAVTTEIINNNPYRGQNNFNDTPVQKIQQPPVQNEKSLHRSESIQNNSNVMPNQYIPTPSEKTEQISEFKKSKSKLFLILLVVIALAAIITIGFAASKLFSSKDENSESATETTSIAAESYSENIAITEVSSESTAVTTTTTITTTTMIASGENACDFIDMHQGEDMRLAPWLSENSASNNYEINSQNCGEFLEEDINNWLDKGDSYKLTSDKKVFDNDKNLIYNNIIQKSDAGIELNSKYNEYYNTVWSNINDNKNYGWLLYDTKSCGYIEGNINSIIDGDKLKLVIDSAKYNIEYHTNNNTVEKQFDMIYLNSGKLEGYLYIRSIQDNISGDNCGYYVIVHYNNNNTNDLFYMDTNNNLYYIKYLLTDKLNEFRIISTNEENEESMQTEQDESNYYNNNSNGIQYTKPKPIATSTHPIVSITQTEPPVFDTSSDLDNSTIEGNDDNTMGD